jgi:hypothetical protein
MLHNPFLPILIQKLSVEKEALKRGLLLLIFNMQPKVSNHQMGEKSPNRVTLRRDTKMFWADLKKRRTLLP